MVIVQGQKNRSKRPWHSAKPLADLKKLGKCWQSYEAEKNLAGLQHGQVGTLPEAHMSDKGIASSRSVTVRQLRLREAAHLDTTCTQCQESHEQFPHLSLQAHQM